MTTALTDLGECGAFVASEHRCHGRLVVVGEVGDLVEGECDVCGTVAARPVGKARPEFEQEREAPWWDK